MPVCATFHDSSLHPTFSSGLTKSPSKGPYTDRSSAPASLGSDKPSAVVERVLDGSDAAAGGLEAGDELMSIVVDGEEVSTAGLSLNQILVRLKKRPRDRPTTLVFKPMTSSFPRTPSPMKRSGLKRVTLGPGPLGMGPYIPPEETHLHC